MSDLEEEFVCSQVSVGEFKDTQSAGYGPNILENYVVGLEKVVSLEAGDLPVYDVTEGGRVECRNERVLYDNVLIEDISSDDEIDGM